MSKSCGEMIRDIAKEYAKKFGKEYEIDQLVSWAIKNGKWELSEEDIFKRARKVFTTALREGKDDDGVRIFVNAKLQQRNLWAHRNDATWPLRQTFLQDQARRAVEMRDAVLRQCEKFNEERKPGEPAFQVHFDWDDDSDTALG